MADCEKAGGLVLDIALSGRIELSIVDVSLSKQSDHTNDRTS